MAQKRGLGKGLDVLIRPNLLQNEKVKNEKTEDGGVRNIKITKIEPNPDQPRDYFDEDSLEELADSIKKNGMIQPITVVDKGDYYMIVAGERRWRAAKQLGLKEVPVIVGDYTEQQIMEISLIENIQREDLNPIEEARAYKKLQDALNLKQDEVADKVSKSRAAVTNSLRLLKLDEKVQNMVIEGQISAGHARALLAIEDKEEQIRLAEQIFDNKMTVRDIEKYIKNLGKPKKKKKKNDLDFIYNDLEEKMKTILGTKVSINAKNEDKGRIEIEYYSKDDLERITDMIVNG
ncbi:MAG: ParB/RepB/Spo0J family partition protein [Lachnospiraceae bacterium]|nr:ParB/RepB/Spo0J family partition protein [Lachnospiraceae bacterium]